MITVHRPARVSANGQRYVSARTETMILRPARFVDPGIMASLLGKGRLYLYGVFDTAAEARSAQKGLAGIVRQSGDPTAILATPAGRYAVVVKSVSGKNYEEEGFAKAFAAPANASPKRVVSSVKTVTNAPERFAAGSKTAKKASASSQTSATTSTSGKPGRKTG